MDIHRYSTAIIGYGHRFIGMDSDSDFGAMTGQGFVDRIIDDLEHHMVQTGAVVGIADVHAGPLPDRIETLQDLDFA
jgi:hypothetical protein